MSFFGFGHGRNTQGDARSGYRWDSPNHSGSKAAHRKGAANRDNGSFSRTPRPDHRQQTNRNAKQANRNDRGHGRPWWS